MPKVLFVNEMVTVEAKPGETVLEVAERAEINVFRGLFQGFHCGNRMKGWCGRCKVWASGLAPGAVNEKTGRETGFRLLGASVPKQGTMRLACQVVVQGDVEVRTRTGWVIKPNATWDADPRKFKWKERWEKRNDEPAEDEKPKKAAAGAVKGAVAAPKAGVTAKSGAAKEAAAKAAPPPTNEPPPAAGEPLATLPAPDAGAVTPPPAQAAAPATVPAIPSQSPEAPEPAPAPAVAVPAKEEAAASPPSPAQAPPKTEEAGGSSEAS